MSLLSRITQDFQAITTLHPSQFPLTYSIPPSQSLDTIRTYFYRARRSLPPPWNTDLLIRTNPSPPPRLILELRKSSPLVLTPSSPPPTSSTPSPFRALINSASPQILEEYEALLSRPSIETEPIYLHTLSTPAAQALALYLLSSRPFPTPSPSPSPPSSPSPSSSPPQSITSLLSSLPEESTS